MKKISIHFFFSVFVGQLGWHHQTVVLGPAKVYSYCLLSYGGCVGLTDRRVLFKSLFIGSWSQCLGHWSPTSWTSSFSLPRIRSCPSNDFDSRCKGSLDFDHRIFRQVVGLDQARLPFSVSWSKVAGTQAWGEKGWIYHSWRSFYQTVWDSQWQKAHYDQGYG